MLYILWRKAKALLLLTANSHEIYMIAYRKYCYRNSVSQLFLPGLLPIKFAYTKVQISGTTSKTFAILSIFLAKKAFYNTTWQLFRMSNNFRTATILLWSLLWQCSKFTEETVKMVYMSKHRTVLYCVIVCMFDCMFVFFFAILCRISAPLIAATLFPNILYSYFKLTFRKSA